MNLTDMPTYSCLALYGLAVVAAAAGFLGQSLRIRALARILCFCGFTAQTLWLLTDIFSGAFVDASRGFYLLPLSWVLAAAGIFLAHRQRQEAILHFVPPWAFFLGACALGFSNTPGVMTMTGPLFLLHLGFIFTGVGVMAVAAGAGVLFLLQEKSIKHKIRLSGIRRDLPSLDALDRINAIATAVGFPCYSFGLLCGFLWARINWGTFLSGDFKEWISLAVFAVYALLFHQRHALGWRGRKPAVLALVIFALSLFSMFVVNAAFPTQHNF